MRRGVAQVMVVLATVTACDTAAGSTTTTATVATTTTTLAETTTTVAETTTTTMVETTTTTDAVEVVSDPLSIVYPDDPETVTDLPRVLQELVGAPMPQPDLTLESEADFGRWLFEWINWYTWLSANPTDDPEVLAVGFMPDTDEFQRQIEIFRTQIEAGRRTLGWWVRVEAMRSADPSIMFEQRVSGVIGFEGTQTYPRYAVDSSDQVIGAVTDDRTYDIAMSLRNVEEVGWRIEFLDVVPLSS
jgi:hypothetical protein